MNRAADEHPRGNDPAFPALHVRPRTGWVNDPNGLFRWRGRYHVFFQHNPHAPVHADICWGHASSVDLAHWQMHPAALVPTPGGPDSAGCWSGCVVDDDGTATAVYTGAATGPHTATVCLAYAQDDGLRTWRKDPTPAAAPPPDLELLGWRDPFLFTHGGRRYALIGAGLVPRGAPTALLYACDALREWSYLGPLVDSADPVAAAHAPADIWECPALARLGDRWVLIVSLWTAGTLGRAAYLVGDLVDDDAGNPRFRPAGGALVDSGHDFYAPALLREDGRVLLWGWSWEDRADGDVLAADWAGSLTLPRDLRLTRDERLVSTPAPEVSLLRTTPATATVSVGGDSDPLVDLGAGPWDIEAVVRWVEAGPTTLVVHLGSSGLRLTLDPSDGRATLERSVHDPRRAHWPTEGRCGYGGRSARVRVVIDGSLVEVYVADGPVYTERVYPGSAATTSIGVTGPPGARVDLRVWRLAPTSPS